MIKHYAVKHPEELIQELKREQKIIYRLNDRFADWVSVHVLPSLVMFDVAIILPLLALPAPDWVKISLGTFSGSWIQWWALPALQRSANKSQLHQDAKAEVDHKALTHIAHMQDKIYEVLKEKRLPG